MMYSSKKKVREREDVNVQLAFSIVQGVEQEKERKNEVIFKGYKNDTITHRDMKKHFRIN